MRPPPAAAHHVEVVYAAAATAQHFGKMSLVYSFVSRGTTILAEYSACAGNFASVAVECLESVQNPGPTFTVVADGHSFNFLLKGGYTFLVVAEEKWEEQMTVAFLDRVANDFMSKYDTRAKSAPERALSRRFSPILKAHMEFVMSHPDEESRRAAVRDKVEQVKSVMVGNIERVLNRGEQLEFIDGKATEPRTVAKSFNVGSRAVRTRLQCRTSRLWCILITIFATILLLVAPLLTLCFVWEYCLY